MKWTFTASDENMKQQLEESSDSNSSAVAQPDHSRTQTKTEWATKLKEEQEVSLALITTDHSTSTANRADKITAESLDDGCNLDCASVMERNWLKCLKERDEQLSWIDIVHDVQKPDHHVEEQVCSISGATTDNNIRPITVQINDLLLNTTPHSTLTRLNEKETNTIKVPFNHSVSVRLQDCEVMMLKMKMMRKRTWSETLTELNELLLDAMRTPEEQAEVKTIRTSSDNVTDQHQEFEMQILTLKVNWGWKSRLRGGLFFMLPKLEVQFMHDTKGPDQEEID
ncbi:hypothetical protein SRHO_G00272580 [Serrasalmus rhombeus]